jgi:hypothetical protein
VNTGDLAEAFGEQATTVEELDAEEPEAEAASEEAITADADVFFDDTEDRATRLEALRRLVKKLR